MHLYSAHRVLEIRLDTAGFFVANSEHYNTLFYYSVIGQSEFLSWYLTLKPMRKPHTTQTPILQTRDPKL